MGFVIVPKIYLKPFVKPSIKPFIESLVESFNQSISQSVNQFSATRKINDELSEWFDKRPDRELDESLTRKFDTIV